MKVHSPAQAPRGQVTVPLQTHSLFGVVLPLLSFSFQNTLSLGDSTLGSSFYFCYLGTKFPNILFSIPDDDWKLDCSDHLVVSLGSRFSTQQWLLWKTVKIQEKDIRGQEFNWEMIRGLITSPAVMSGELGLHRASALPIPVAAALCCSLMWQKSSGRFSS